MSKKLEQSLLEGLTCEFALNDKEILLRHKDK